MQIDNKIFDELAALVMVNPHLRLMMDLRNSLKDLSLRVLNTLELGTVIVGMFFCVKLVMSKPVT